MVVVIGGGISGLATAWFLHQQGVAVRVLEAGDRFGGKIQTEHRGGYVIECGPNSVLRKPATDEDALGRLVDGAGFSDRYVEAGDAGHKRFIVRDGRTQNLPASPLGFAATRLFSWRAKLRLMREPFIGAGTSEETIAQFVERRLGREFLDYAIEPFISGVYAGDPGQLSVRAAVPRIHDLEKEYGSLIRGAIARGRVARGAGMPAGGMHSFEEGMATLPQKLAAALPEGACRTGCSVEALEKTDGGWSVSWKSARDAGVEKAKAVVVATPAPQAAELLEPLSSEGADILRSIPYASLVGVAFGYERDQVGHALDGFGFLVPRLEGLRMLGGLFSSSLFARRAPSGKMLISAFIGGARDAGAVTLSDDELLGTVSEELSRCLNISGAPCFSHISRHKRAIPQYTLGHLDRLRSLDGELSGLNGLYLQASWRGGVSVGDCVRNAETLAREICAKNPNLPRIKERV